MPNPKTRHKYHMIMETMLMEMVDLILPFLNDPISFDELKEIVAVPEKEKCHFDIPGKFI